MIRGIPERWRLLSGQNKWKNLLNPLDNDLRKYLVHYGAMAQATYDTFNSKKNSKYSGTSKYAKKNLFSRVGLVYNNPFQYEVVKYIYATSEVGLPDEFMLKSLTDDPWCGESNWIGYVAVATDEGKIALGRRDILVAWRGTIKPVEWLKDFDFPLVPAGEIVGATSGDVDASVHKGFLSMYTSDDEKSRFNKSSARDQVLSEVKRQVEQYKDEEISITVTGHSMGAALAVMNAADIVANGINKRRSSSVNQQDEPSSCLVTAFVYACARPGDSKYKDVLHTMKDLRVLNIRNEPDFIPHVPPFPYTDIGVKLKLDSRKSPYLKPNGNGISWHNLEGAYLHALSATEGNEELRDIALVNKQIAALKDEYLIPEIWWILSNKGMVQKSDGSWELHDHETDDDDPDV